MPQRELSEKEMLATMREDEQKQYIEAREKLLEDLREAPRVVNGVLIEAKCAETGCEADIYRETIKRLEKRNLDLSGDVGRLSAITLVALDLLKRFVQQSRGMHGRDLLTGGDNSHFFFDGFVEFQLLCSERDFPKLICHLRQIKAFVFRKSYGRL